MHLHDTYSLTSHLSSIFNAGFGLAGNAPTATEIPQFEFGLSPFDVRITVNSWSFRWGDVFLKSNEKVQK